MQYGPVNPVWVAEQWVHKVIQNCMSLKLCNFDENHFILGYGVFGLRMTKQQATSHFHVKWAMLRPFSSPWHHSRTSLYIFTSHGLLVYQLPTFIWIATWNTVTYYYPLSVTSEGNGRPVYISKFETASIFRPWLGDSVAGRVWLFCNLFARLDGRCTSPYKVIHHQCDWLTQHLEGGFALWRAEQVLASFPGQPHEAARGGDHLTANQDRRSDYGHQYLRYMQASEPVLQYSSRPVQQHPNSQLKRETERAREPPLLPRFYECESESVLV